MIKITTPIYLTLKTKKGSKNHYLNMNNYRNIHFFVNNKLKILFKEFLREQLEGLKIGKIKSITYKLYYPDKRVRDKMNYIAVIDKYFMDALVHYGCIEDDNDKYTGEVKILNSEIDKDNSRCEIIIEKKP